MTSRRKGHTVLGGGLGSCLVVPAEVGVSGCDTDGRAVAVAKERLHEAARQDRAG